MKKKLNAAVILCFAFVFGSTVRAQSSTGMNNAALKGDYAFTFDGMITGGGNNSTPFAAVGRFTSDGAGNLTNGELDTNGVGLPEKLIAQSFTGTYSIGADNRGIMNLNIPGGGTLAFAMMANGNAKFVEIDASGGHGTVGSGTMEKADTTAYSTAKIMGDYAFGVAGLDNSNNRNAIAGRFTANGAGNVSNGVVDINQWGRFTSAAAVPVGNYSVTDTTTGRGMMTLPGLLGIPPQNLNFVFYVVNARKVFAMEMDAVTPATPLLNGSVLQQQAPLGGFSSSSLNAGMVFSLTGRSPVCGGSAGAAPNVFAGLLTADSIGTLTLTFDQNCGGAPTSATGLVGTYTVASNGRATFRVGADFLVAYLVSANQALFIVPDSSVLFGFGEPQAAGSFTNNAVQGTYAGSATAPATLGVATFSGEFTADGASPTGNITGIEDIGSPNGPSLAMPVNATYSISSSPTNGRGTMKGGIGGSAIVYVISSSKFVVVSLNDLNPAVLIFQQ